MRVILAPLTRWLDRRIDARIAVAEIRRRGIDHFADMARDGIHAAFEAERDRRQFEVPAVCNCHLVNHAAQSIRDTAALHVKETSGA